MNKIPMNNRFTTTRWSLVAASTRPGDARFRSALEELTRQYRNAIVAFIINYYHCGMDEAEDITQEFIMRWVERGFTNVVPDRIALVDAAS